MRELLARRLSRGADGNSHTKLRAAKFKRYHYQQRRRLEQHRHAGDIS